MAHPTLARIRRRAFALLTILSLLMCVAMVGLWGRSYWIFDRCTRYYPIDTKLVSISGGIVLMHAAWSDGSTQHWWVVGSEPITIEAIDFVAYRLDRSPGPRWLRQIGFEVAIESNTPEVTSTVIAVPHWFLVLLFAVLPAMRLRSILRTRRRHRDGLCQHCGYDLRATPDRCPECGMANPKAV